MEAGDTRRRLHMAREGQKECIAKEEQTSSSRIFTTTLKLRQTLW
jgi:hypothetical protein